MTKREFVGEHHYKFCRKAFDEASSFLKSCGKPDDWYDKWLIKFHKETKAIFKGYVNA